MGYRGTYRIRSDASRPPITSSTACRVYARCLLEDDFPALSEALTEANASIGFADPVKVAVASFRRLASNG